MEKIKIFDEYAQSQDFDDWNDLKNCCIEFDMDIDEHIFAACDLVQKEQQKRIAENAQVRHDLNKLNEPNAAEYGKYFGGDGATFYCVEKSSIISENNLIK